jgi:hypothetical protein
MKRLLVALCLAAFSAAIVALAGSGQAIAKGPPPGHGGGHGHGHHGHPPPSVSVYATGFNNPRGLEFGPGHNLYVAEGGLGGTVSTVGQCDQVPPPIGPYLGSTNDPVMGGRISMVAPDGTVSTVVDALPSSQTDIASGSLVSGVADVAFLHGQLYGLLSGAGCSHGVPTVPNQVFRVDGNTWTTVADLSTYLQTHPVANPPDDFEPDGTWYSMVAAKQSLYAVEPNHGEVDRVWPDGTIRRVVDFSAHFGHVVPTAIAHHGVFYVGSLGEFDPNDGAGDEHVYQLNPNGHIRARSTGVEKVVGVAFRHGKLYVLELSTTAGGPTPGSGAIVEVRGRHVVRTIVSGLMFPTGMTLGPDGAFYVSENGFGFPAGQGRVIRVALH